jgi:RimJ/RimL family protein N-acetyltransferase
MPDILFFRSSPLPAHPGPAHVLDFTSTSLEVWTPGVAQTHPKGMPRFPYLVWWLFHYAGVFRNDQYRIFLVRDGASVVHRSCLFPPFFRFPFMGPRDVQVGDVWTSEGRRGQGLSAATLRQIIDCYADRSVWFLCEEGNKASARLASRAGMQLVGVGAREPRLGLGVLGQFVLRAPAK